MNLARRTSLHSYNDLKEVAKHEAGAYCIPSNSDQAAIDNIKQPNFLFQMTVADHHDINAKGLSDAIEQLQKDPDTDAELIFVVPPDKFSRCV